MATTTIPLTVGSGLKEVEDTGDLPDVLSILSAAAGGDAKVIIYRHSAAAKLEYVETVQLAAISSQGLDYIQRKHGGGDYRLQVHGKRSDGRSGIVKAFDVSISALPVAVQSTATMPQYPQYAPMQPTWDGDKIIAVLTAAAPLVRAGAEWWSARQQPTVYQYANPVQGGSGLTALSETLMSLQIMGQLKETVSDVFGNVASDGGGGQRGALLQALAPALGMMMGGGQPAVNPVQAAAADVSCETIQDQDQDQEGEEMAGKEPSEYEKVLYLVAEAIKAGNQDTVIALLEACSPSVSANILGASPMHVAVYAAQMGLSVAAVRAALESARVAINATPAHQ